MTLDSSFAAKETASQEAQPEENAALAEEALSQTAAPRKLEPEQMTGIVNVASNFGEGVVNELIHNPGTLALNAAGSFGIGYLANKGLQSAAMRIPTIGLMTAAGAYGLYELGKALPGWKQSFDIASDPSAYDAASVLQAEKHIQSIGGGTLEFGVGGVAGGLAFKPGVSAAAESLLVKTRATIFGEKPQIKQFGPDGKEIFLADEINGLSGAKATDVADATLAAVSESRLPQAFKLDGDGNPAEGIVLTYGDEGNATVFEMPVVSQGNLLSHQALRARNASAVGKFDDELTAAQSVIAGINNTMLAGEQHIMPGVSQVTTLTGRLLKTTVEGRTGIWEQYYQYGKDKTWSSVIMQKSGDADPVTVHLRDGKFFVSSRDGIDAEWKGTLGNEGLWTKAADEPFATPYDMAKALPKTRYAEASQNGAKYAAEVDNSSEAALAGPEAREIFSGEPRRLIKMSKGSHDNYFRYDDNGQMVGWTIKTANGHAFELQVTDKGLQIPIGDGTHTLWKGNFQNGRWKAASDEKYDFPEVLIQHLLWV